MSKGRRYLDLVAVMDAADRQEEILDDLIAQVSCYADAQDEEPQTTRELETSLAEHRKVCEAEERRCPYEAKLEKKIEENKNADRSDVIPQQSEAPRVNRKREELKRQILKRQKDLKDVDKVIDSIIGMKHSKARKAALHWVCKGTVRMPEDAPKIEEAIGYGERAKGKGNTDPMSYDSPMAMINALHEFKPKGKAIDPDTVPELSDKQVLPMGVTTYLVRDDEDGQRAMRKIIDTHWGEDANPWCLLARDKSRDAEYNAAELNENDFWDWWESLPANEKNRIGETDVYRDGEDTDDIDADASAKDKARLYYSEYVKQGGDYIDDSSMASAWHYWNHYNALPKRVAFKDGKLLAFMATDVAISDSTRVDEDEIAERFPQYTEEYDNADFSTEYIPPTFLDWLAEKHPDAVEGVGEQWWDRNDKDHPGIPLGNMKLPDDPYGRYADFEIRNGKVKPVGDFVKGERGQPGYVAWHDDGSLKEADVNGKIYKFTKMSGQPYFTETWGTFTPVANDKAVNEVYSKYTKG